MCRRQRDERLARTPPGEELAGRAVRSDLEVRLGRVERGVNDRVRQVRRGHRCAQLLPFVMRVTVAVSATQIAVLAATPLSRQRGPAAGRAPIDVSERWQGHHRA